MQPSDLAPGLVLGDGVPLGEGVRIGAHVVIHAGTVVGDGCEIQDGAVLGKPPKLARHSTAPRGDGEPLVLEAGAVVCCARDRVRRRADRRGRDPRRPVVRARARADRRRAP